MLFLGSGGASTNPALIPRAESGVALFDLNRRQDKVFRPNPLPLPAEAVRDLLRDAREARVKPLAPLPPGVTDLRLDRVWTWNGRVGFHLKAL